MIDIHTQLLNALCSQYYALCKTLYCTFICLQISKIYLSQTALLQSFYPKSKVLS